MTETRTSTISINRRTVLAGVAVSAVGGGTATIASAQPSATGAAKGPKVWLDMDQQELDDAYNQAKYAPNFVQVMKRYASNSAAMRTRVGEPKRVNYGPTSIEKLERAGAHYVVPDFISVDETKGDLLPMVDQVRRAIAWTVRNAQSFGGDSSRIYLSSFSSGSHLAGVALLTEWKKDFALPDDVIKGAVMSSGLYDLKAVRLSARSKYVNISDEVEEALSTQRHMEKIRTPLVLAHGTYETPEFKRQTRDFAAALKAADKPVKFFINENYNHFEMMETFGNPYGLLGREMLQQMQLQGA
jgi:arylformamidase